jgi:hypothetical protein
VKILLQHARTQLYLRHLGSWTDEAARAYNFVHSRRAIAFARQHDVTGVQVAVNFNDAVRDDVFPVSNRTGA